MKARRQARAGSIQAVFLLDALHVMPPGSNGVSSDAWSGPFGRQHGILEPEAGRGYIARAGRQKDPMKEGRGVARPASIRCCGRFCAPYGACDRLLCASSRYVPEGCDMDDGGLAQHRRAPHFFHHTCHGRQYLSGLGVIRAGRESLLM